MERFFARLADILEVDVVEPGAVLREFPAWDSLGVLSIQAMIDEDYGVSVVAADLAEVRTAGELAELVRQRSTR